MRAGDFGAQLWARVSSDLQQRPPRAPLAQLIDDNISSPPATKTTTTTTTPPA